MNKAVLICLLILSNITLNTVKASVTVTVKNEQHTFDHEPYLTEVLAPIAYQSNWYWASAALYQVDNALLEEKRYILLNNLANMINEYQTQKPKTALSLKQLYTTIASWRLAKRLPNKIDYDLARVIASENPRLPSGKYILDLSLRVNSIQLFGAIRNTIKVPHLGHADASEYTDSLNLSDLADKDIVIIIQSDGRQITAPVAYWNKGHQEVMPGSQIFVPFKHSLFHPEFADINQQITTLAINRVQ